MKISGKPLFWYYYKLMAAIGYYIFGSSSVFYYAFLDTACSQGFNYYGQPINDSGKGVLLILKNGYTFKMRLNRFFYKHGDIIEMSSNTNLLKVYYPPYIRIISKIWPLLKPKFIEL